MTSVASRPKNTTSRKNFWLMAHKKGRFVLMINFMPFIIYKLYFLYFSLYYQLFAQRNVYREIRRLYL